MSHGVGWMRAHRKREKSNTHLLYHNSDHISDMR